MLENIGAFNVAFSIVLQKENYSMTESVKCYISNNGSRDKCPFEQLCDNLSFYVYKEYVNSTCPWRTKISFEHNKRKRFPNKKK